MKILEKTFAVFWSMTGSKVQFHADVHAETPVEAAKKFRDLYPEDVIHSVRDRSGRFRTFGA